MKTLEFTLPLFSLASPYQQMAVVVSNDMLIGSISGSTVPNYRLPNSPDRPNLDEYPIICGGMYEGVFSLKGHKGSVPAIIISDNGDVPVYQVGNPRFPNQGKYATHIHIHEGYTDSWRGSAGCPALSIGGGNFLKASFKDGEHLLVTIPDPFWFAFEGK